MSDTKKSLLIQNDFYLDAKENKNFLNFAVKNYKCGTFLDLLNVCHDDLNKVNAKNETLLDHVIENDSKFDNSFIRRILFKLPNDFKVQLHDQSFSKARERMKDLKYWDTLKILIEKMDFNGFKSEPINDLINESAFESSFFKQINLNSSIFKKRTGLNVSEKAFINLCERNDPDLFKLIKEKFSFDKVSLKDMII